LFITLRHERTIINSWESKGIKQF